MGERQKQKLKPLTTLTTVLGLICGKVQMQEDWEGLSQDVPSFVCPLPKMEIMQQGSPSVCFLQPPPPPPRQKPAQPERLKIKRDTAAAVI